MSDIRKGLVYAALNKSVALIDYNIYDDFHKRHEFKQQTILADKSLTNDEKAYAIRRLNKVYDRYKVQYNEGTKRICENCSQECLATLYCELCVRNYLKANFQNWTSGNDDIDNLIKKCQMETLLLEGVIEWIPYDKLQDIEYLTEGGFSEIYKAIWIDGRIDKWDSKNRNWRRLNQNIFVSLKCLINPDNITLEFMNKVLLLIIYFNFY